MSGQIKRADVPIGRQARYQIVEYMAVRRPTVYQINFFGGVWHECSFLVAQFETAQCATLRIMPRFRFRRPLPRLRKRFAEYFIDAAQSCPLCFRHVAGGAVCGSCQKKPPAFDRMWASLYYEPPVSSMIRELKHLADLGMSRPLADLMCQNAPDWLATEHFDFVLPMPLSKERRLSADSTKARR